MVNSVMCLSLQSNAAEPTCLLSTWSNQPTAAQPCTGYSCSREPVCIHGEYETVLERFVRLTLFVYMDIPLYVLFIKRGY